MLRTFLFLTFEFVSSLVLRISILLFVIPIQWYWAVSS
jgi:hypothetical protein